MAFSRSRPIAPLYNIIIIFDTTGLYLGRKEKLNRKTNEFNSAAMFPRWDEPPMLCCGQINVPTTTAGNVKIVLPEKIALLLYPHVDVQRSLVT